MMLIDKINICAFQPRSFYLAAEANLAAFYRLTETFTE